MERPSKRRRLFAPLDSELSQRLDNRNAYYEEPDELDGEDPEPAYDPEHDLQQKRARLDLKFKSTLESIFEKYGKSFDGVGDEIDLYTGEILVDNGHLLQMQSERDAGDPSHSRVPRALAEVSHGLMSGSVEDDYEDDEDEDDEDEDYDNEEALSDGDMVEDDMILRGFAQARQFMERKPPVEQNMLGQNKEMRRGEVLHATSARSTLPSRSNILSQFGPQLGPEIVKYVSQQATLEDKSIEPIWRAPPILPATSSVKRPMIKAGPIQPEVERPMSPDNSPSIWAPQRSRFVADDDELLQVFVAKARRMGLDLSSHASWKQLEDVHPRHGWKAWKSRYEKKFTYMYTGQADESEVSTSGVSTDTPQISNRRDFVARSRLALVSSASRRQPQPTTNERSTRVRKQAPRDSTILSWTDAVASIESLDPDLHAGLLKDIKNIGSDASFGFQHLEPSSRNADRHIVQDQSVSRMQIDSNHGIDGLSRQVTHSNSNDLDTEDELLHHHSELYSGSQKVPCPHGNCRSSQSTLYRLGCYDGEELSPLCLHLLRVHHSTPFPCAEFNCDRKGERGYFTQEDLVRHVKEAHPYATALSRLRSRVDAELLDQNPSSRLPHESAHAHPRTPISQPRDLNFISPKGRIGRLSQSKTHLPSSGSLHNLTPSVRPQGYHQAVSAAALEVDPLSSTARPSPGREYSVEKLYDSDVQILDSNPFSTDRRSSSSKQTRFTCSFKDSIGCEKTFTTQGIASSHSLVHTKEKSKAPCTYPGCKRMISTVLPSTMIAHLKTHEKESSNVSISSVKQMSTPKPRPSLPTSIPNGLHSSASHTNNETSTPTQRHTRGTTKKRMSDPLPRNMVDPSYEFSDEELVLPPLAKEALPSKKAEPAQPRSARRSMPSSKASIKTPSTLSVKKRSLVTPLVKAVKAEPRESPVESTTCTEELDELSIPADHDLMIISSRPRPRGSSNLRLQIRVKEEDADIPSSGKRRTSMLERSDEVDELGSDEVTVIASARRITTLTEHPEVKIEVKTEEEEVQAASHPSARPQATPNKARKHRSTLPGPPQPIATPTRDHRPPPRSHTSLIDRVRDGDEGSATSDPYSSPIVRQTRIRAGRQAAGPGGRLGLHTATVARRGLRATTIKREGDEGVVWTPGGTLRRCGQDGFMCGRPFCFTCVQ